MGTITDNLAVQSYCYRGFADNAKVAKLVRECGLTFVETCSIHVNFEDPSSFDQVIDTYAQAGIALVGAGVEFITLDEAAMRRRFDFVRKCGAKVINIAFPVDATDANYRLAETLCDEYDVKGTMHNHGSRHWQGSVESIVRLFERTNERIGLCLDTAWAMDSREDPIAMAEQFADRLYSVHLKDFVFERDATPKDVVIGTGNLDLNTFMQTLVKVGFSGPAIIEYEADIDDPVPALTKCAQAIRATGV